MMLISWCMFFFFKQKTAYEMRIIDWSSDVCSADRGAPGDELVESIAHAARHFDHSPGIVSLRAGLAVDESGRLPFHQAESALDQIGLLSDHEIGRASCRERVCQYV